ncbi:relaxin receptor 2 [Octopus bimaculoides]|nr:relaxin receptor 2 [Octopus bimaculoides]|eukprot:XP_014780264.1 PREDICTED: relaxin receptor 2-like [Octopus bimaculoides]
MVMGAKKMSTIVSMVIFASWFLCNKFIDANMVTNKVTPLPTTLSHIQPSLVCNAGYFACKDQLKCLHQRKQCDGVSHCKDGSDEEDCDNELDDNMWNNLWGKRKDEAHQFSEKKCTDDLCECKEEKFWYCVNTGLQKIPDTIPVTAVTLDLSANHITYLNQSALRSFHNLKELSLNDNGLRILEAGAFHNCPELETISLKLNRLEELVPNLFPKNNSLKYLYLDQNWLTEIPAKTFDHLSKLIKLSLRRNRIKTIEPAAFYGTSSLVQLFLDNNMLTVIKRHYFEKLTNLGELYLINNKISSIEPNSFDALTQLQNLILRQNRFTKLVNGMFAGLKSIQYLNLEENQIEHIEEKSFMYVENLISLYLADNPFRTMPPNTLKGLINLKFIHFSVFYTCIYALHVRVCNPKGDGLSSTKNLIENPVLRVGVWVIGVVGVLGNCLVLLGRFCINEDNKVHSFYIQNLALADMLMGVYLLTVGSKDMFYREKYLSNDQQWRYSWLCNSCGVISTISTEMSVFTVVLITLDRYINVVYPFSLHKCGRKTAYFLILSMWLANFLLAVLPVLGIPYFGEHFYRNNAVCLPLHIHEPYIKGWEYSAFLFLGINVLAFIFISYAYFVMFCNIRKSAMSLRTNRENHDHLIMKRFSMIVLTDFMCWVPIITVKTVALAGYHIDDNLYAWLAIFILPINSALNPLIYTMMTTHFKRAVLKNVLVRAFGKVNQSDLTGSSCGVLRQHSCVQVTELKIMADDCRTKSTNKNAVIM